VLSETIKNLLEEEQFEKENKKGKLEKKKKSLILAQLWA